MRVVGMSRSVRRTRLGRWGGALVALSLVVTPSVALVTAQPASAECEDPAAPTPETCRPDEVVYYNPMSVRLFDLYLDALQPSTRRLNYGNAPAFATSIGKSSSPATVDTIDGAFGNARGLWQVSFRVPEQGLPAGKTITLRAPRVALAPDKDGVVRTAGISWPTTKGSYAVAHNFYGCGIRQTERDFSSAYVSCDSKTENGADFQSNVYDVSSVSTTATSSSVTLTLGAPLTPFGCTGCDPELDKTYRTATVFIAGPLAPPSGCYAGSQFTLTHSEAALARSSQGFPCFGADLPVQARSSLSLPTPSVQVTSPTAMPASAVVTLRDQFDNRVPNRDVELTSTGDATVTSSTSVSGDDGTLTFSVSDLKAEQVRVSATVKPGVLDPIFTLPADTSQGPLQTFTAGPPVTPSDSTSLPEDKRSKISVFPSSSFPSDGTSGAFVLIKLVDQYGNPGARHVVLVAPDKDDEGVRVVPIATDSILAPNSVCPSNVASAPFGCANANGSVGFGVVDDTPGTTVLRVTDVTTGTTFHYDPADPATNANVATLVAQPVNSASDVVLDRTAASSDGLSSVRVTVRPKAVGSGAAFLGEEVVLSTTGSAVVTPVASTATCTTPVPAGSTDCLGEATFDVTDDVSEVVTLTASVGEEPVVLSARPTITFRPGPSLTASPLAVVSGSKTTLLATIKNSSGAPIQGATVSFAGGGGVAPTNVVTDAQGRATSQGTVTSASAPSNAPGTNVFTASATFARPGSTCPAETTPVTLTGGGAGCKTETLRVSVAIVKALGSASSLSADPVTAFSDGISSSTVTARALDTDGDPVQGVVLRLSSVIATTNSPSSARIAVRDATTDQNGVATWTVTDQVTETVQFRAVNLSANSAAFPGDSTGARVSFVKELTEASQSRATATSPVAADGTSSSLVVVSLRDGSDQPLPNRTVLVSTNLPTTTVTQVTSPSNATPLPNGLTNPDGQAFFRVTDTKAENVRLLITDATSGTTLERMPVIAFTAPPSEANLSTVTLNKNPLDLGEVTQGLVVLRAANGTPLTGRRVTLTGTAADGSTAAITPGGPGLDTTDSGGLAEFDVSSSTAGSFVLTATDTSNGTVLDARPVLVVNPAPSLSNRSTVVAEPSSLRYDQGGSTVTVTVRDASGQPVAGHGLSPVLRSTTAVAAPSTGITTDADGVATFVVTNTVAEVVNVEVDDITAGVTLAQQPDITFLPPATQANNSSVTVDPARLPAGGAKSTVTVTLRDPSGAPLVGRTVALATGSSTTSTAVVGDPVSDSAGRVVFAVSDTDLETITVTATDTTTGTVLEQRPTITFTEAPSEAVQSTVSAVPDTLLADGQARTTVSVLLTEQGSPVAGSTVVLRNTGQATVTALQPVTDSNGLAVFRMTSTAVEDLLVGASDTTRGIDLQSRAPVRFTSPAPEVTAVTPASGDQAGGNEVVITGTDLSSPTSVRFGSNPASSIVSASRTSLRVVAPPGTPGTVAVTVTTPAGTSPASDAARYTWTATPTSTPTTGGPTSTPTTGGPTSTPTTGGPTSTPTTGGPTTAPPSNGLRNGAFFPLTSSRLLDTRVAPAQTLGEGGTVDVAVAGRGGVPATGATAVLLNVTALARTKSTHITAYPAGTARPEASILNALRGQTVANLVQLPLGANGAVTFYNIFGETNLVVDVVGYIAPQTALGKGLLRTVGITRLVDTRNAARIGPGASLTLKVIGRDGLPSTGVGAVVLNVTGIAPTTSTHITAHAGGTPAPNASNINIGAGQTVANRVIVPVGSDGTVRLRNNAGAIHLAVDVAAYYTDGTDPTATGMVFTPLSPRRVLDTRTTNGALTVADTLTLQLSGVAGVPSTGVGAVLLNLTVTRTTATSFLTAFPTGTTRPGSSDINWVAGRTVPNLALVPLSTAGAIDLYNNSGSTDVVADLEGYYS
jgi:IPT/TIG domain/Bacterial Ig-like domain (group 1)